MFSVGRAPGAPTLVTTSGASASGSDPAVAGHVLRCDTQEERDGWVQSCTKVLMEGSLLQFVGRVSGAGCSVV